MTTTQHDPALIDELARHFLRKAYEGGDPPFDDDAWLAGARKSLAKSNTPQQVESKLLNLRARAAGKRITRCREVRGTHGVDYAYDPAGTDPPPTWWSEDTAKRAAERRHLRAV